MSDSDPFYDIAGEPVGPIEVSPVRELVARELKRMIHLGVLLPGDKLPSERELASRMKVSRVTVREAIRLLQGEGYIRTTRGATGGTLVLPTGELREQLRDRMRAGLREIDDILDFRVAAEGAAAALAATRASEAAVRYLNDTVEEIRRAETMSEFRRGDSRFHIGVAQAAGSPMLTDAVVDARAAMFLPLNALEMEDRVQVDDSIREHRRVIRAITAGHAAQARRAMTEHIETTRTEMHEMVGGA
jgi:DNA-binding FadR family transcriptional regulator